MRAASWITFVAVAGALTHCDAAPAPDVRAPPRATSGAPPEALAQSSAARPDVEFIETLSPGARATDALPMVVAIHGLGDNPRSFSYVLDGLTAPARLVMPRGLDRYHDGWSWFPFSRGDSSRNAPGIRVAAARLAALLEWLSANRRTTGKPIVTGFSQGGMLTFALAVHHPDVVSSAYPLGGVLPEPLWPQSKQPNRTYPAIFALHGAEDPLVPLEPTRRGVERLRELGFAVELRSYDGVGHALSSPMRSELAARIDADCRALVKSSAHR